MGKPFERKGRKTMGLQMKVYDCQVALKKCSLAIFYIEMWQNGVIGREHYL